VMWVLSQLLKRIFRWSRMAMCRHVSPLNSQTGMCGTSATYASSSRCASRVVCHSVWREGNTSTSSSLLSCSKVNPA
jgi:hypothetical protein